jgi:preprotein translocase subunit SecA
VGTASVEKSEIVHQMLKAAKVPHSVLNAKHHGHEAGIVAQAGRPGAVTISTNMAGRGTDILLGGNAEFMAKEEVGRWNPEAEPQEEYNNRLKAAMASHTSQCAADKQSVLDAGGLMVVGTERHESRRIDNQLRGRAGRQGDPGMSRFFLSLEDELLRIFGSDKLKGLMERMGMEDGVPLEHPWLTRAVENAQSKVEGRNFGIRKNLLEYDEVNSQQRDAVYGMRRRIIKGEDTRGLVLDIVHDALLLLVESHFPAKAAPEDLDVPGYNKAVKMTLPVPGLELTLDRVYHVPHEEIVGELMKLVGDWYTSKEQLIGEENTRYRERYFLLTIIDDLWKKHLQAMSHLRSGIGLRGYGQRNPLLEYKKEGFNMFQMMLDQRDKRVIEQLFGNLDKERELTEEEKQALLEEQREREIQRAAEAVEKANKMGHGKPGDGAAAMAAARAAQNRPASGGPAGRPVTARPQATIRRDGLKVGRNDPCWCGSGNKYKKCHMASDLESSGDQPGAPA